MIIIWRGMGAVVPILCIVGAILTNVITSAVFSEENYFAHHVWPPVLAFCLAGAACWPLGRRLNRKAPQIFVDKATGREYLVRPSPAHHLMFIPLEFWAAILSAVGVVVFIIGFRRG